jgi:hypothetical protein
MTVASFSAHCGSDFCDALWVSRMVRRGGDGPGFHGPAGLMEVARYLMRAASGQATAKARYGLAKDQAKKDVEAWFRSLP